MENSAREKRRQAVQELLEYVKPLFKVFKIAFRQEKEQKSKVSTSKRYWGLTKQVSFFYKER
jgi:hypothetical protein